MAPPIVRSPDGAVTVPFAMIKVEVVALVANVQAPPCPLNVVVTPLKFEVLVEKIVFPVVVALKWRIEVDRNVAEDEAVNDPPKVVVAVVSKVAPVARWSEPSVGDTAAFPFTDIVPVA